MVLDVFGSLAARTHWAERRPHLAPLHHGSILAGMLSYTIEMIRGEFRYLATAEQYTG